MSPKTLKTPRKRDRASLSDINIVFNEQTFEQNQENEHHCETELGNEQTNTETSSKLYKNSDISENHGTNSDEPFHPVTDMDTAAAVQQLFTLTPAVAASQGATPKAKSSAKAAATASTPGTDMDTAAAVQQLFTLVLSVGRMYLQRSKFTKLRKATVGLQTAFRGYIAKKSYKFTVSQIVKVQSVGRMRLKRGSNHISPVALGGGAAATSPSTRKLLRIEQPAPGECACDV